MEAVGRPLANRSGRQTASGRQIPVFGGMTRGERGEREKERERRERREEREQTQITKKPEKN